MPDITKNVTNSDGSRKARNRLTKRKSMYARDKWLNAFNLEIARSNLIGGAYEWWCMKKNFIEAFDKTFLKIEGLPAKWKRMTEKVEEKNESIFSYFYPKVRL
ncbi:hypothetical protein QE152_g30885 [Popillia japonica]|uniref:Uncharacterized protein n=1 Tax=Popillia japonica TaxID=7064 RepID=A0AAW1JDD4_POPJA